MTPETLHPCAHRIALTYPFAEHCWPFGPEYDVFKVDGRIFMITMTIRGRALVNLKAEPQKSLLNQQIYRSIEPGYVPRVNDSPVPVRCCGGYKEGIEAP